MKTVTTAPTNKTNDNEEIDDSINDDICHIHYELSGTNTFGFRVSVLGQGKYSTIDFIAMSSWS